MSTSLWSNVLGTLIRGRYPYFPYFLCYLRSQKFHNLSSMDITFYGFTLCKANFTMMHKTISREFVVLSINVDDIPLNVEMRLSKLLARCTL